MGSGGFFATLQPHAGPGGPAQSLGVGVQRRARVNLCFHGIGEPRRELEAGEKPYWIAEETFIDILDLVAGRPEVSLSFDDGNSSDIRLGLPALRRRGLTATFFPLAGRLGEEGSLGGGDLRTLVSEGMAVGSHGMRHQPWRGLSPAEAEVEFDEARQLISAATGRPVSEAACPFGDYDRAALSSLRGRGFRQVFTSDRARAGEDRWLQPRYSLTETDTVDSVASILRGSAARDVLDRARTTIKRWR